MQKIDSNRMQVIMGILLVLLLIAQFFIGNDAPQQVADVPPAPTKINMPIFVRGTMNEWGLANSFSPSSNLDEFSAIVDLEPGSYRFKIADETWSVVDLGGQQPDTTLAFNQKTALGIRGSDLILNIDEKTTVVFVLTGTMSDAMSLELFKAKI